MTTLVLLAVILANGAIFVWVIAHLLADNRRLTAALVAPHPAQATSVLSAPDRPARKDSDERPLRPVGA